MSFSEAMAIAEARIAEEAERPTGSLDLSDLDLRALPKALAELTALQALYCSNTQVSDLSPLNGLTALQTLECIHTQVSELSPLAGLTALQTLNCSYIEVSDLSPLAGLTALQNLNCSATQVNDLSSLCGFRRKSATHSDLISAGIPI